MCADSRGNGESAFGRALRTQKTAQVFRAAYDAAYADYESAFDRMKEAESLALMAEDEASRAYSAWQLWQRENPESRP